MIEPGRPLSRTELLALLEFLPLHHAEDLPDQAPYDHLRTLLIGLAENFEEDEDELAFFLGTEPGSLIAAIGPGWSREADRPVRDRSRLWYFDGESPHVTIGVGPEDVIVGMAVEHGPELGLDEQIACLPRAITTELVDAVTHGRTDH
ncbi:hypothetical protein [Actinoplanes sp. L3-i22]|uniref:hypothetical protein n=1 Tax=Actinoplanes sp. L3-i22 TaxID=2836373 RepID=UPI001C753488|nr:hypothetical protein [Actinoplanes sp. L3-i22]BCY10141.1 hypothetical protein L3i22_052290 [Actinoplanes sp. L3-i22]